MSPTDYCARVEDYLCRRNGGHKIRIIGPAWEMVLAWETQGIPIKVVFGGIDRYLDRHANTRRRRPVPIQFCEADVLDAFDHWRRAVGISATVVREDSATTEGEEREPERRHGSLPAHLERVIARLTALRGGPDRLLDETLDGIVRELDGARARAKGLRGEARDVFLARLQALDASLVAAARERLDVSEQTRLRSEADAELAPFRQRLQRDAYEQAVNACVDRLVRERYRLPAIAFE